MSRDRVDGMRLVCTFAVSGAAICMLAIVLLVLPTQAFARDRLFVIEGHGYGHGVGMGQYGAEGFAAHGLDYRGVLAHYYPGTKIAQAPPDAHVRVLLESSVPSIVVGSVNAMRLVDGSGSWATLPPGRYRLDGNLVVHSGDRSIAPRSPVRIAPTAAPLTLNGKAYRGSFVFRPVGGGVGVINDVAVDDYVRGVIAWEMPADWHQEALRAQAVAARSYALASLTPSRSFDVYSDQRSQMYGGLRAERAAADHAVLTTLSQVLVWNGHVASTYFSSSSGGRTAAAADVWPSGRALPYLISVPDPYDSRSPEHHWGPYLLSATTLAARLGVPAVASVRIVSARSGRTALLRISTGERVIGISAEKAARALGLRSTWFTIRSSDQPARRLAVKSVRPPIRRRSGVSTTGQTVPPPPSTAPIWLLALATLAASCLVAVTWRAPKKRRPLLATGGVAILTCIGALALENHVNFPRSASSRLNPTPQPTASPPAGTPATKESPGLTEGSSPAIAQVPGAPETGRPLEWHESLAASARRSDRNPEASPSGFSAVAAPPAWTRVQEDPPKPPEPLAISDVSVHSLSASSLRVTWRTNLPATAQGATGLALNPRMWTDAQPSGLEHETVLTRLSPDTAYHIWLLAHDDYGQAAGTELVAATPPAPDETTVVTQGDTILVDGHPTFPLMLWAMCASEAGATLALGINTFMGNSCGSAADLVRALDDRALAVIDRTDDAPVANGVLGTYYPDEWDAFLPGSINRDQLLSSTPRGTAQGLSFLTLTNHFYSRASPLPQGKGMYPTLFSIPDVLGFDLYPLQTWCRPAFGDVFDAQSELQTASGDKPTFQWIEVAPMEHPCNTNPALNPTPATVRAETWLAIAGGADGIGYFPNTWTPEIGDSIARTSWDIRELAPALLAADAQATTTTNGIRVAARTLNGALYVIAVNTTSSDVTAGIEVPGLAGRTSDVPGENRTVPATLDTLHDDFSPLAAHIYVAAPIGWTQTSFDSPTAPAPPAPEDESNQPNSRGAY